MNILLYDSENKKSGWLYLFGFLIPVDIEWENEEEEVDAE